MKKKLLALLLCAHILITAVVPVKIFAADTPDTDPSVPATTAAVETESTESTVPDGTDSTESTVPDGTDPTESTVPDSTDSTESTLPDSTDSTESTVPDGTDPTESTVPDSTDPTESTVPDSTDPTESTVPDGTDPTESTIPEETDPTETTAPQETTPAETEPEETFPEEDEDISFFADFEEGSYQDFLAKEAAKAWDNPALYVDFEAVFNHELWSDYRCSADPTVTVPQDEEIYVYAEDLMDEDGRSIQVLITDAWLDETNELLWFKVEAPEDAVLPEILEENPYILQLTYPGDLPSLRILPHLGTFAEETVFLQKQTVAASRYLELPAADLPDFFPVSWMDTLSDGSWYDLGDTSSWPGVTSAEYRYVQESAVIMIPAEVSRAYEELLATDDLEDFLEMLEELPEEIREQFTGKHLAGLEAREERLYELAHVEHSTVISYGGADLTVTVHGKIPETGVTLDVTPVSHETVWAEGFDLSDSTGIIAALDIKLLRDEDGSEWQPDEGDTIDVSIDMAPLGYEDGSILQLHHKHGERIDKFDIFIVMDGKVTVTTDGLSIYLVNSTTQTAAQNATPITSPITMEAGETRYFYFRRQTTNNWGQTTTISKGTWQITDTAGAIYYTVHASNTNLNGNGIFTPWIRITALKETASDSSVNVRFHYGNTNDHEDYTLRITAPKADAGQRKLYIKDEVNTSGSIVAKVTDASGNILENALVGASFSWTRSDGLFIVPPAYSANYDAVNIARDHAGLVETRKTADGYQPVTYTLTATLADGDVLTGSYTVYYQSEFINAGFESPQVNATNCTFLPNGWPELYWKTTAPGATGSDPNANVAKDIEFGSFKPGLQNSTSFGVTQAADANVEGVNGVQFAELNAEAFGSLYQDIITAPGEDIEWDFSHAPRVGQSWAQTIPNAMYIVIGATEDAQKLTTQGQLEALGKKAKDAGVTDPAKQPVTVKTDDGATYFVWYDNAGTTRYNQTYNGKWTDLHGSYTVPAGQYRTRLFFVSDSTGAEKENAGNLIDQATAGQYKNYLIEYYKESFLNTDSSNETKITLLTQYTETGRELIYSSPKIQNLDTIIEEEHDYLQLILVNGDTYPYDIRYLEDDEDEDTDPEPGLYIENYPKKPGWDPEGKYSNYDIVVQIYVRDTVIAVKKNLVFPTALTEEQKLTIMNNLQKNGGAGYQATYKLHGGSFATIPEASVTITKRDMLGNYSGFVSLGNNPQANGTSYTVEESALTDLPGLRLDRVRIETATYKMGHKQDIHLANYTVTNMKPTDKIVSSDFILTTNERIAELVFTNTYEEIESTFRYQAVGNGKVYIKGQSAESAQDAPFETPKYYSESAVGGTPLAGSNATFIGWYLDEACTKPVQPIDGVFYKVDTVVNGVTIPAGTFQPNPNTQATEKTFYAKFESGTITIIRENAEPYQSFVYRITGVTGTDKTFTMDVTLECDASGNGSRVIYEVPAGTYTVEELNDWSWRYPREETQTQTHSDPNTRADLTFKFSGPYNKKPWLNGYSAIKENMEGLTE